MREASELRLPRAKEARSLKLGKPECWPIATGIHLCATSHICHRSFTPFFGKLFAGKSVWRQVHTCMMQRKDFVFLLTEVSYQSQDWGNESYYCDGYLSFARVSRG